MKKAIPPTILFGDLFELQMYPDGTCKADLGTHTKPLALQFALKHSTLEMLLWLSFLNLKKTLVDKMVPIPFPREKDSSEVLPNDLIRELVPEERNSPLIQTNIFEIFEAAQANEREARELRSLLSSISIALGSEFEVLADDKEPTADRQVAIKRLKRRFGNVFQAYLDGIDRSGHAGSAMILCGMADGSKKLMPLPWLILQLAPRLLEQTRTLPSKKELRDFVQARFPKPAFSDAKWAAAYRDAGLESLPRSSAW